MEPPPKHRGAPPAKDPRAARRAGPSYDRPAGRGDRPGDRDRDRDRGGDKGRNRGDKDKDKGEGKKVKYNDE